MNQDIAVRQLDELSGLMAELAANHNSAAPINVKNRTEREQ